MKLNIKIFADAMYRHQRNYAALFSAGLKKHGLDCRIQNARDYQPCDLAVIWGLRYQHIIIGQEKNGSDYLLMERGFIGDRFDYTAVGYNGLNGRADFYAKDMPPDRWQAHAHLMQPWKNRGKYILLAGQVAGDASIKGVDIHTWYAKTAAILKKRYTLPVKFRPHPLSRQQPDININGLEFISGDLHQNLNEAHCLVAYNSNSAVDAVLAGVPVIVANPGSMAWPVALHWLEGELIRPDRSQWAYDLSYCQWNTAEIDSGAAWDHLKQRYEQ